MALPPELGSDKFDRWARKVWPYLVGVFGMVLVTIDCVIVPPPGQTAVIGMGCITGMGYAGLNRSRKAHRDDE